MRFVAVLAFFVALIASACTTNPTVRDSLHVIEVDRDFDQRDFFPPDHDLNFYFEQSILFAELGSRFFNMGEYDTARQYFDLAVTYNQYNNKAHFSLGLLKYADGDVADALASFRRVRRQPRLFPYDIDYHRAAQMILEQFPISPRVISLTRNDRSIVDDNDIIIVNKGRYHGVVNGMEFTVYRIGHPIRDFETLRELGVQKTPIGRVSVIELNDENSVCRVDRVEAGYFIQINDLLETDF